MRLRPLWRRARYLLLCGLLLPAARLPRPWGLRVFAGLGSLAWHLLPAPRRAILENLRAVHPGWAEAERRRFGRRSLAWLGRNGFDFIRLRRYSEADLRRLVRIEGGEHLDRALAGGRGVICLGAHLGCWELLPLRLRAAGYPVALVYRRLRSPELQAFVAARRARAGIETFDRDRDARGMVRCLRRGALLGLLIDQRTRVDSVRVPFLGCPAWTPTGPVRLAMRTGAPVLTLVTAMEPGGGHRLVIGEPVPIEIPPRAAGPGARQRAVAVNTARCNEALGRAIEACSEQWVWFHRRWKDL